MEETIKKSIPVVILIILLVLSFIVLKPILLSIIFGFILAFIFSPVYKFLVKITKSPNFSAFFMCIFLILLIILPIWFFTSTIIDQAFKIYQSAQKIDFVTPLKMVFPSLFSSDQFAQEIGSILHSFVVNTSNSLVNSLTQIILDFPTLLLQLLVVFFTFFFALRDQDQFVEYMKSLLPFSKPVQDRFIHSSKEITSSVLYGHVIVGLIQGIIVGIGLFIFRTPNPFILTVVAIILGILPIIGTVAVWLPVMIYFSLHGNITAVFGILVFGLLSGLADPLLRPLFVSKRANVHSAIVLIGMIGGIFAFGVLGILVGPLIIAYLTIILEIYRDQKSPAQQEK
jgi:predicted PurR-regulated permease PerM